MKNLFFLTTIVFLQISCNSNKTKSEEKNSSEKVDVMIPKSGCYAFYSTKDTILLKVEVFPNVVTGILKYRISEKDKNEGTIKGKLEGNKLFADYTFFSEGRTSVREVAFLLNENEAIEGFGEMKDDNDKMSFKDKIAVNFTKGIKLTQINCMENDSKFKIKQLKNE